MRESYNYFGEKDCSVEYYEEIANNFGDMSVRIVCSANAYLKEVARILLPFTEPLSNKCAIQSTHVYDLSPLPC